jgi:hypothetical protein
MLLAALVSPGVASPATEVEGAPVVDGVEGGFFND